MPFFIKIRPIVGRIPACPGVYLGQALSSRKRPYPGRAQCLACLAFLRFGLPKWVLSYPFGFFVYNPGFLPGALFLACLAFCSPYFGLHIKLPICIFQVVSLVSRLVRSNTIVRFHHLRIYRVYSPGIYPKVRYILWPMARFL